METPLTPLEFARRARKLYGDREAVVDGDLRSDLRAVLRPLRSLVGGAAATRRGPRRSRRVHRAEHARAARVVLRGAADRRGAGADQLPADCRRFRLHHQSQRRAGRLRARRLPRRGRQHPRHSCRRSSISSRSKAAREGWLDYEQLLADGVGRVSRGRRSPKATC